jgi:hypothetical protein
MKSGLATPISNYLSDIFLLGMAMLGLLAWRRVDRA